MLQKNKRPIPKEFCIQKPVATPAANIPKEETEAIFTAENSSDTEQSTPKEDPKVIFTAENVYKHGHRKEASSYQCPKSNSKNMLGPAVAAMLLMDVLK